MGISTHILDTSRGKPAEGVTVVLHAQDGAGWRELARGVTNADGRVKLVWRRTRNADDEELQLTWEETDGPAVATPARQGFGSRLITGGLARELGGLVTLDYRPSGVVCQINARLGPTGESNRFIRGAA